MQKMPDASSELLGQLVEQRAEFASTCCPPNSPPLYCASKVKPWTPPDTPPHAVLAASPCGSFQPPVLQVTAELGEACDGDTCLLS